MRGWHTIRWLTTAAVLATATATAAPKLTPKLRIVAEERFDDDLVFRTEPGTTGTGQFMTRLTPELSAKFADRTFAMDAFYAGDMRMRHGSGVFTLEHRAGLGGQGRISPRLALKGEAGFWRVVDPTSLPRLGLARTFEPIVYGRANVEWDWAMADRWHFRPGYQFEGARVLTAGAPPGFVHAPFAEVRHLLSRRAWLGFEYRFQSFQLGADGSSAHSGTAAVGFRLTRQLLLTARGGPVWYAGDTSGGGSGWVPRVNLELASDGRHFDWTVVLGHDLVGASGFTAAVWADYASATIGWRVARSVRLFTDGSVFRNGLAPDQGYSFKQFVPDGVSAGYAVGGGVEWEISRRVSMQGAVTRIVQVAGGVDVPGGSLTRNIAAVRLLVTAF